MGSIVNTAGVGTEDIIENSWKCYFDWEHHIMSFGAFRDEFEGYHDKFGNIICIWKDIFMKRAEAVS